VRVVHGFGSGALRRAVQDYLSSSAYCSEFRSAGNDEGGAAVTVVELNV
jgi:DNA mismatch repair protein MutS2